MPVGGSLVVMSHDLASELSQRYADKAAEAATRIASARCRWLPDEASGQSFELVGAALARQPRFAIAMLEPKFYPSRRNMRPSRKGEADGAPDILQPGGTLRGCVLAQGTLGPGVTLL